MKYSKQDKQDMYEDYRRGFEHGAQVRGILGLLGTPAPTFQEAFERGVRDGREAATNALKAEFERLKQLPEHD